MTKQTSSSTKPKTPGRQPARVTVNPRRPRRMARPGTDQPLASAPVEPTSPVLPSSKIAGVIALLGSEEGAILAELVTATGWLPHTARAALTGLRKKGHAILRTRRGEETCYRIDGTA